MTGKYRLRLRIRHHLPWALINLGIAAKGKRNCGDHSGYNADNEVERCHYCDVGERPYDPRHFIDP